MMFNVGSFTVKDGSVGFWH